MKDYNRWTDKEHKYKGCVDCTYRNCQYCDAIVEYEKEAYNRLCDLEDKIENGTLVELPTTDKDILEDYAHKIFDSWNDITGAVNKNCSWYYEALWVIDDIVGMVWGITSRQYEAKLKELKGERE